MTFAQLNLVKYVPLFFLKPKGHDYYSVLALGRKSKFRSRVVADHFEVFSSGEGRIFVILHPACGVDRERILDLLVEAGFDPAVVTFLTPEEAREEIAEGQGCTIIPVDGNVTDALELEEAARRRAQSGRVVVVLAEGFKPDGLHPIAVKYGSQCGWSAGDLGAQITGTHDLTKPVDASGSSVERPKSKPVNC